MRLLVREWVQHRVQRAKDDAAVARCKTPAKRYLVGFVRELREILQATPKHSKTDNTTNCFKYLPQRPTYQPIVTPPCLFVASLHLVYMHDISDTSQCVHSADSIQIIALVAMWHFYNFISSNTSGKLHFHPCIYLTKPLFSLPAPACVQERARDVQETQVTCAAYAKPSDTDIFHSLESYAVVFCMHR